jgi:cell wall-associated NlpC family hydrolase
MRHLPRPRLAAAALALVATLAAAEPPADESRGDAILQLLQDKGLMAPAETAHGFVQTVRDTASDLVISAMNFLGVPYRRGGQSEDGFDCSGFTRHVFEKSLGLVLPRRADQQAKDGALAEVKRDELKPGDLVFFNTMKRAFSHVGIYVGDGKFIHAPRSGAQVRIEDMRAAYWTQRYNGARRADMPAAADGATPRTR